ncbi:MULTISPECIES: hypothetical protein [Streptomyces]|uniref:hypothetical protein n=1 Tax=Streptomyces TaxID=1883 RepID=UPI003B839229
MAFRPERGLTYDVAVRPAIAFRLLDSREAEDGHLGAARVRLQEPQVPADDLSRAPLGKPQRREAARKSTWVIGRGRCRGAPPSDARLRCPPPSTGRA